MHVLKQVLKAVINKYRDYSQLFSSESKQPTYAWIGTKVRIIPSARKGHFLRSQLQFSYRSIHREKRVLGILIINSVYITFCHGMEHKGLFNGQWWIFFRIYAKIPLSCPSIMESDFIKFHYATLVIILLTSYFPLAKILLIKKLLAYCKFFPILDIQCF